MPDSGENQNQGGGMKVIHLEVENFKRVQAIELTSNGQTEVISGENEQGKTSILDALACVIGGGKLVPDVPIRKGQKKARVKAVIGREPYTIETADFTVERRFEKSGPKNGTLTITGKNAPLSKQQDFLDQLFGNLSFDPLAFADGKTAQDRSRRFQTLREIVGVDFSELDQERAQLYEQRKYTNQEVKQLEGKVENLDHFPEAPKERVDTSALMAELKTAEQQNRAAEAAEREIETLTTRDQQYEAELARLRARAEEVKAERATIREQMVKAANGAVEAVDTSAITDKLVNAQELNDKVDANIRKRETESELRQKAGAAQKLTLAIEAIDEKKAQQLAEAKFPVAGLGFDDGGVLFNDLPFEQASEEQQIVVSAAIGLALHPTLRTLLVRKAALLDKKHRSALIQWGKDNDVQQYIEIVGTEGGSVVIEEGLIKSRTPLDA
jgi:predicted ATP-dependent endonuclease of OLD family